MPSGFPENVSPKYQQVFEELRRDLLSGKYPPGRKLPSEADLVERFGASRITIGRAMRELRQRNLIERRAGSGTYALADRAQGFSFGLLIPDLGRTEVFELICQGMTDAPQAANHLLLWGNAGQGGNGMISTAAWHEQTWQLCQQYISRRASGVFFAPLERSDPADRINARIIAAFEQARIPVVLLDRDFLPYPQRSRCDLVGIDNRRAGYLVTAHLLALGARRPVFLTYPGAASTVDERIAGCREALFAQGREIAPALVQTLDPADSGAVRRLWKTLRPDAAICANDRTAAALMRTLLALGRRVPQDVRVTGIDDLDFAPLLPVPLTTVRQPCREIGLAAMSAMLERIARPDMPARDVRLECRLVVRESCGGSTAGCELRDAAGSR